MNRERRGFVAHRVWQRLDLLVHGVDKEEGFSRIWDAHRLALHMSGHLALRTYHPDPDPVNGDDEEDQTTVLGGESDPDPEGDTRAKRQPTKKYHLHPFVKQFLLNPLEWTAEQHLEVLRDRVSPAERTGSACAGRRTTGDRFRGGR